LLEFRIEDTARANITTVAMTTAIHRQLPPDEGWLAPGPPGPPPGRMSRMSPGCLLMPPSYAGVSDFGPTGG
jgi:hypothetical protein